MRRARRAPRCGALASELSALLDDRGRRERLGSQGPARARALCDPASQMPRIAEILQEAAAQLTPMKIAVISYRLPIEGEKRGGIERVAHVLADGLARRGHAVRCFRTIPSRPAPPYDVRMLPWKSFVETWAGLRMTAGYLGNLLALQVDVREFDAVIAHGDSLLLSMGRKPVVRVMHGSALGEARHATSIGRAVLQWGVYLQELLTAFISPSGVVGVSVNTQRDNPFVRQHHPARRRHRRSSGPTADWEVTRIRRSCLSARLTGANAADSCSTSSTA